MAEVQSRASARGRGSNRARGGFRGRGGRMQSNGDKMADQVEDKDEGEVGQLKKQYGSKVNTIQELFPNWTDEDVVYAIQECDGDLDLTVDRITEGTISQWGEVSKSKKDRSRSKVKDTSSAAFTEVTNQSKGGRGGRGGFEGGRGRSRGAERGRGRRGRGTSSISHTNGRKENETSVPTTESTAWESTANDDSWAISKPIDDSWADAAAKVDAHPPAKPTSSIIPDGVKKSWASMFTPAPVPKKAPEPKEQIPDQTKVPEQAGQSTPDIDASVSQPVVGLPSEVTAVQTPPFEEAAVSITPSKDELTETNLEQVPDVSQPAPTATAASTAASSWDPRTAAGNLTPYSSLQHGQPPSSRPPTSGYQASALKATGVSGRTPSFQRRILDQEEAVRMPGNREVDRAAVQFGAFNLNGGGEEDVDGDREEPETRAQPPQHSPVAHPRAALPPAPQQAASVSDSLPTPKMPTGLPAAATQPTAAPGLPSPQNLPQAPSQPATQPSGQFGQFGRYGQPGVQEQPSSLPQKPYDPFSQQAPSTQSPFEGYHGQQAHSQQPQPQTQTAAFSSAPNDYSSYYTSDPQQRNAYNNYYQQQYGMQQQAAQGQQDSSASQQRSFSSYNNPQAEGSQYPQGQSAAQQAPGRFGSTGESQHSGHSTPNQANQGHQGGSQSAQLQPAHSQQPQGPNYPYNHPYYSSPYYATYMNQYQGYAGGSQYGAGPYGAKGGLHNQPYQGYAMSPQAPYDHASSPAATGGFGASSLHARDSALGGSLGDYGRAGSAQSSHGPQGMAASSAFGNVHDSFGRADSYQGQNQHFGAQQGGQQPGGGDDLKPFGDPKSGNGPSPSIAQAGRPGSAANTASGSALPPPQSHQAGYGGYPAHLQQQGHGLHSNQSASQYAGLGGVGGHGAGGQGHQSSQYGGGYQGFGGNNYYGNNQQRGGWGGNYGH